MPGASPQPIDAMQKMTMPTTYARPTAVVIAERARRTS